MGVKIVYTVSEQGAIEAHGVPSDLDLDDPCLTHCYLGKTAAISLALANATHAAQAAGSTFELLKCQELKEYVRRLSTESQAIIAEAEANLLVKK